MVVYAKYSHPKSDEGLEYKSTIEIKDSGKQPVVMTLKFDGIYPFVAPMPPEKHVIRAKDLPELFLKLNRWFKKYGYEIY